MKKTGQWFDGMTMRDYFAASALGGIDVDVIDDMGADPAPLIAKRCYAIADAMMAARDGDEDGVFE